MNVEKIVQEHRKLLEAKGYTEPGVSSSEKPGTLAAELEQKLLKAVQVTKPDNPVKWFRTQLKGKLYKSDDITYNFNYCYDSRTNDLLLTGVEAHYKEMWKMAVFVRPQDCPTVQDIKALVRPKSLKRKPLLIRTDNNKTKGMKL
jgi:hypothetical protein